MAPALAKTSDIKNETDGPDEPISIGKSMIGAGATRGNMGKKRISKEAHRLGESAAPRAETAIPPAGEGVVHHGRDAQVMLRVRSELKRVIIAEAHRRAMSVQTLILRALRDAGLPIEDEDLEDLRTGGRAGHRKRRGLLERRPDRVKERLASGLMAAGSGGEGGSGDVLALLVRMLDRLVAGEGTSPISISNHCHCGCVGAGGDARPQRLRGKNSKGLKTGC